MSVDHASIELLVLDVDGVLTDGSIFLSDSGEEFKRFNVRDGFGIRLWQRLGFRIAIITGRSGRALQHRCAELRIADVVQGSKDKGAAVAALVERTGVPAQRMAFIADDWPDLTAMKRVGLPVAVADADARVLAAAAMVTQRPGGHGAVREVVGHLLAAKGLLEKAASLYDEAG